MSDNLQIEWVEIPAGDFIYGFDEIASLEKPYLIAKTPITYAQYKVFIDANPDQPLPENWNAEARTYEAKFEKHPVGFVSYAMSEAFCSWAGCRLPTEEEWEKAARGDNGNIYPWGDEILNPPDDYLVFNKRGRTAPVDSHPKGASPYGVLEMAGNVYEWTSGWYNEDQVMRTGRGGFFGAKKDYVTTRYRKNLHPDFETDSVGFRPVKDI